MKLSKHTIDVLKSFSTINSNILLEPGNTLKTISVATNIIAFAEIDQPIESEFGIYNLNEFLGALSLFKEPEIEIGEKFTKVSDSQNSGISLKYIGASKDVLVYPQRDVKVPKFDVEFELSQEQLQTILKSASVIGAPDIQIIGSESGLSVKVCDRKNPSSNDFQIQLNQDQSEDFVYNLKIDNLKLFPGDHKVGISAKGLSLWKNEKAKVKVFIALEAA